MSSEVPDLGIRALFWSEMTTQAHPEVVKLAVIINFLTKNLPYSKLPFDCQKVLLRAPQQGTQCHGRPIGGGENRSEFGQNFDQRDLFPSKV